MNRTIGIVLSVLVGIAAGICFLLSITNVIQQSMLPLGKDLQTINANIREIKGQLSGGGNNQVLERLTMIDKRLGLMEDRIKAGAAPQAPTPQMPPSEDYNKVYTIDISKSYVYGKKGAPITIVEFTDFQCPFCSRFHGPALEAVKAYPDKVNYVIKNFPLPFHPNARPAAKAALAAGEQGKYFEMADALLANQQKLSDEGYKELAKQIGLNVNKFEKDLKEKDAQFEAAIVQDLKTVEEVDVRGTPSFFLNGKKTMARDLAGYKREIDQILAGQGAK